jgi:hypothetical protein
MNNNQVDITWATATETNNDYSPLKKVKTELILKHHLLLMLQEIAITY